MRRMYDFECKKCKTVYEELTEYDATGKYKGVKCPHCGSKRKIKLMNCCAFNFTNPVGTDRWNSDDTGHDYRFKHNAPNVKKEREMAEQMSHMGADPYGALNDVSQYDEGIHDATARKGLG